MIPLKMTTLWSKRIGDITPHSLCHTTMSNIFVHVVCMLCCGICSMSFGLIYTLYLKSSCDLSQFLNTFFNIVYTYILHYAHIAVQSPTQMGKLFFFSIQLFQGLQPIHLSDMCFFLFLYTIGCLNNFPSIT